MGIPRNVFYGLSRVSGLPIEDRIILPFAMVEGKVKFLFVLHESRICDVSIIENWPDVLQVDLASREIVGCDDTTFRTDDVGQPTKLLALIPVRPDTPLDPKVKWFWFSEKSLACLVMGKRKGLSARVRKFLLGVNYYMLIRAVRSIS